MLSVSKSWRSIAARVVSLLTLIVFVYGAGRFYDGPISECSTGYCSTRHQPHTAAEYRDYKAWERTILIMWPLGMAALFLLNRKSKGSE
jgi:hypothetical protein